MAQKARLPQRCPAVTLHRWARHSLDPWGGALANFGANAQVRGMAHKLTPTGPDGMPTRQQVLDFLAQAEEPAGKRELVKAFGLKGTEKIALKALLKDMAEDGLIDGKKSAFHRMGGVPKVTTLKIVAIEEGELIAEPDNWDPEAPGKPPRLRVREPRPRPGVKRPPALKRGDRVLARTEETRVSQALAALKARIFPRLRQWGVAKLVAEYSGYGDDGCINSLGYFDTQGQPVNMDLVRPASDPEIQNLLYELLPDGFETGEGGQGDLTVDVETGTVTLEHGENYTETTSSTSQWEV
jgi:hypothetical protein